MSNHEKKEYVDFLNTEFYSHQKSGSFRPNALFTRTVADADLDPERREPYPAALPIHVHEYIHYLHNISTLPGILFLLNELFFVFEFIKGTDKRGRYEPAKAGLAKFDYMADTYRILIGGMTSEPLPNEVRVKSWRFSPPQLTDKTITIQGQEIRDLKLTSINAEAESFDSTMYPISFDVGLTFITEGIAYEVDREIRRKIGIWGDLDENVPSFPYLAYRHLIDFLLGRASSYEERIILGTCALCSPSPGAELVNACSTLGTESLESVRFTSYREQTTLNLRDFHSNFTKNFIPEATKYFASSPLVSRGLQDYFSIITTAMHARSKSPFLELNFCNLLHIADFRLAIADTAPQWVSQEKSDGTRWISWHGNAGIVESIDESAISTLQSIFHYIQIHMRSDGSVMATETIGKSECPFWGACQVQTDSNYPPECANSPWTVSLQLPKEQANHVCFYNAGVMSLFEDDGVSS